jgi:hypothetical protein
MICETTFDLGVSGYFSLLEIAIGLDPSTVALAVAGSGHAAIPLQVWVFPLFLDLLPFPSCISSLSRVFYVLERIRMDI